MITAPVLPKRFRNGSSAGVLPRPHSHVCVAGSSPRLALLVVKIRGQQRPAPFHQTAELACAGSLGQIRLNRLIGNVMRRDCFRVATEGRLFATRPVNEQIAVADSGMEFPGRTTALVFLQQLNQFTGQVVGDLAGREAAHAAIGHVDEIAADGPIQRAKFNALSGRFDGSSPGVVFERVITEQAHRADIAAGRHRRGNMVRLSDQPFAGQRIHMRCWSGLERRLPAERLLPFIRGPIGDNKCVFHSVGLRRAEPAAQIWRTPARHASDGRGEYNLNMPTSWPEPRSAYLHVPFCASVRLLRFHAGCPAGRPDRRLSRCSRDRSGPSRPAA